MREGVEHEKHTWREKSNGVKSMERPNHLVVVVLVDLDGGPGNGLGD